MLGLSLLRQVSARRRLALCTQTPRFKATPVARTFFASRFQSDPSNATPSEAGAAAAGTPSRASGKGQTRATRTAAKEKKPAVKVKAKPKPKPKPKPKKPKAKPAPKLTRLEKLGGIESTRLWTPPPKQPRMGAYLTFVGEARKGQTISMKEVAQKWVALSETEKERFAQIAQTENDARHKALVEWEARSSPEAKRQYQSYIRLKHRISARKMKERRGDAGLKRPTPPYTQFVKDWYQKQPERKTVGIRNNTSEVAKAWKELTLGQKAPYVAAYEEEFKEYLQKKTQMIEHKLKETQAQVSNSNSASTS